MKKLFGLVLVLMLVFSVNVLAAETTETLTFEWTQEDTTNLKEWKLFWSDVAGGSYTEIAVITYNPENEGPVHTGVEEILVTGDQATYVKKYFVLRACGDIPQPDGTATYLCSEDSNEVSHDFWIPAGVFSVPVQFKMIKQ